MIWMVKNTNDNRVVLKHKQFDRYYVSNLISILDNVDELQLFTTKDIEEAYKVLEATKFHWAGINVDKWRVVEAPG